MQLRSLRPKNGASLTQLREMLGGKGWRSALPTALPDSVLLRLALDFRRVEGSFLPNSDSADGDQISLAAAMYVIMSLLIDHPERLGEPHSLKLPEKALIRTIGIYQQGLEREIVTRLSGSPASAHPEAVADELVRCVNEFHGSLTG